MPHVVNVWISRIVVAVMHLGCLLAIGYGVSWVAAAVAIAAYVVRGFAVTGGYHRYFAHRSYRTGRVFQSILALIGVTAVQGGPLHWAKDHRHHHRESDQPKDLHSPRPPENGWWSHFCHFWWSHLGWILSSRVPEMQTHVRDLEKYPELVWIERLQLLVIGAYIAALYFLGDFLGEAYGTSGMQMVTWGFFISTAFTWHVTWCVNSVTHTFGTRRYETTDDSKNNWIVGLFALGEGHHNNHHAHQHICRQGLLWWELDLTYYILKLLSYVGVTWDLNEPEPEVFIVARSLGKIRNELRKRRLEEEAIAARLLEGQSQFARAIRAMAHARNELKEKFRKKMISLHEMADELSAAAKRFTASLQQTEAAALAA